MGFVGELMQDKGVAGYYIIGLLVFMALFVIILVRTIRMPKAVLVKYKTDILDEEDLGHDIKLDK